MAEKGTMTATFEPTLEVRKLLEGKPTEYVVVNPVEVEAKFEDGRVVRYPQDIRERVTRCRDCKHAYPRGGELDCSHFMQWDYYSDEPGHWPVEPDGFCAWGSPREVD